jgi:hypothetical protein
MLRGQGANAGPQDYDIERMYSSSAAGALIAAAAALGTLVTG